MTDPRKPGHIDEPEGTRPPVWRRSKRDLANVVWISFLTASVATMVFFAMVDPEVLSGYNTLGWHISRQTGYAFGFFGLWLLTGITSFLSVYLVRTERRARDFPAVHGQASAHTAPDDSADPDRRDP